MGQYKVPQDVEAEDKILGPYTLKQFIYAVIGVAYGFLTFRIFFATTPVLFFIIGVPPTILMLMLGLYQRKDQPFEALFLALVAFWTKPRTRIWLKEPITEVFKIVQPPLKEDVTQRSPGEVRSQLEHVAQVIDTRGVRTDYDDEGNEIGESPLLDLTERLISPSLIETRDIGGDVPIDPLSTIAKRPTPQPAASSIPPPDPSLYGPQAAIISIEEAPAANPVQESPAPAPQQPAPQDDTTLREGQSVSIR
jgi:hypothetical protein